jgi:hypothetical protein
MEQQMASSLGRAIASNPASRAKGKMAKLEARSRNPIIQPDIELGKIADRIAERQNITNPNIADLRQLIKLLGDVNPLDKTSELSKSGFLSQPDSPVFQRISWALFSVINRNRTFTRDWRTESEVDLAIGCLHEIVRLSPSDRSRDLFTGLRDITRTSYQTNERGPLSPYMEKEMGAVRDELLLRFPMLGIEANPMNIEFQAAYMEVAFRLPGINDAERISHLVALGKLAALNVHANEIYNQAMYTSLARTASDKAFSEDTRSQAFETLSIALNRYTYIIPEDARHFLIMVALDETVSASVRIASINCLSKFPHEDTTITESLVEILRDERNYQFNSQKSDAAEPLEDRYLLRQALEAAVDGFNDRRGKNHYDDVHCPSVPLNQALGKNDGERIKAHIEQVYHLMPERALPRLTKRIEELTATLALGSGNA